MKSRDKADSNNDTAFNNTEITP